MITEPGTNHEVERRVERRELAIRRVAWSRAAPIARVEVNIASGPWEQARLLVERSGHSR